MEKYPLGTRLLLKASNATGVGVQELYDFRLVRWVIMSLDRLWGSPPS